MCVCDVQYLKKKKVLFGAIVEYIFLLSFVYLNQVMKFKYT